MSWLEEYLMNANLQRISLNIFYLFYFFFTNGLTSVMPKNISRTVYSKKKEEKPIVLFYDISNGDYPWHQLS